MSEDRKYFHETKDTALAYIGIRVVDDISEKFSLLYEGIDKLAWVLCDVFRFKLGDCLGSN